MIEVVKYSIEYEGSWNKLIEEARNGHFIFNRKYLDYHSDKFLDESLLFFKKGILIAALPANRNNDSLVSHEGLSFGGLIVNCNLSFFDIELIFRELFDYMDRVGLKSLRYQPIPFFYHLMPCCEDLVILNRIKHISVKRDIFSIIDITLPKINYSKAVRWAINKAERNGMQVKVNNNFSPFMVILKELLEKKYNTSPVHSLSEIERLKTCFPENIQLQEVYLKGELLGGVILYLSGRVVHTQYTAMTESGKKHRALPFLIHSIIQQYKGEKRYLSLGTSRGGCFINENLYRFKESLGARAMFQEEYTLSK